MIRRKHSLIDAPVAEQDSETRNDEPDDLKDTGHENKTDDAQSLPLPLPNKLRRGVPFGR